MIYAGKYNAPDYELILNEGCNLAIESTMIYHCPQVKEQLEKAGCPILGVVLNKVNMKQNKYYGKYYGQYYGDYGKK